MVRWGIVIALLAACQSKPTAAGAGSAAPAAAVTQGSLSPAPRMTRPECLEVRDHVVQLLSNHYLRNPDETWAGLDRTDPAITEGLDPGLTKENFAAFLAADAGKAWLARARLRATADVAMTATVETCVDRATATHRACWMDAPTIEVFQACPNP